MPARVDVTLEDLVRLQFGPQRFSLLPRQPVTGLLSGRHASRLRGRGLIFEELRNYRPGDDIRTIDWKATARLQRPFVRVYAEERERPVLLIVDQRTPMFFGSARTTKAVAAAEVAALAAWRTLAAGDRAGAIIITDDGVTEIRPHRSRARVLQICRQLAAANQKLTATATQGRPGNSAATLNDALQRACNAARHDHLVIVVTDLADADETTREHATQLAAHNDVIAVLVYDPLGAALPVLTSMKVTDGSRTVTLPRDSGFQTRFTDEFQQRCDQLKSLLLSLRVPILPICTHDPVPQQIAAALGKQP